jgi:hypothetical protein
MPPPKVEAKRISPTALAAPRSPWQNGHVERFIGSIWCESLDHLVVFDEVQLRRVLKNYAFYYNQVRTHLSLDKNAPDPQRPQKFSPIAAISTHNLDLTVRAVTLLCALPRREKIFRHCPEIIIGFSRIPSPSVCNKTSLGSASFPKMRGGTVYAS